MIENLDFYILIDEMKNSTKHCKVCKDNIKEAIYNIRNKIEFNFYFKYVDDIHGHIVLETKERGKGKVPNLIN